MPGEHSYSSRAVQALCDHYYTNPGTRVEQIRTLAAAGQLETITPDGPTKGMIVPLPAELQAEIAQISRAQMFELLRQDPRHHGNTSAVLEQMWADITDDLEAIDRMPARSTKQAIDRDKRRRSLLHTIRLYEEAKNRLPQPSEAPQHHQTGLLATLTRFNPVCARCTTPDTCEHQRACTIQREHALSTIRT